MDFSKFVFGSVYYLGMFLTILIVGGRRLIVIGTISGAVVFPILLGGLQPLVVELLAGAILGFIFSWMGSLVKEKLEPYLRVYIDPDAWMVETGKVAGIPPLSPEEKSVRLTLASAAAAGASTAGLLLLWISERSIPKLPSQQLFEQLFIWLLTIVVMAWVGTSLFNLPLGASKRPDGVQRGKTWVKVSLLAFLLAISQEVIGNLLEKGLQLKNGVGVWILLVNGLTAGVVTYYWTAGAQLRQRSIARRAAYYSTWLGGLMIFPPMAFISLKILPYTASRQEVILYFLLAIILASAISLIYGFLFFGLNALAGGAALRWVGTIPAAPRLLLGLIPVAALSAIFFYVSQTFLLTGLTPDQKPLALDWWDWVHPFTGPLGWSLGLWVNPEFARLVEAYNRGQESPNDPSPASEH
ncbi:MAG: hypothetical protein HY787_05020 [Deltaproteobacteria bacterium]|nr:hypothetical protein [Deltaproteobacteria bacterium]